MKTSHILRTDGGSKLGFGHISRCMILAKAIKARGGMPEIVLGYADTHAAERIQREGINCRKLEYANTFDAKHVMGGCRTGIFDFSHMQTREQVEAAHQMFASLRSKNARTLLIDAKGRDCLSSIKSMQANILTIPYAGADTQHVLPGADEDLRGLQYCVLDTSLPEPFHLASVVPEVASRLLVTAGGSDPKGLTLFFMNVLDQIKLPLKARIVIGPGFTHELTQLIEARTHSLRHDVTIIRSPPTLIHEMLSTHFALSASGLTKYELAYTGTPSLLVSIDRNHAVANVPFAALETGHDVGELATVTTRHVAQSLKSLLVDKGRRQAFSIAGRRAVDGLGTQRLLELLDDETT